MTKKDYTALVFVIDESGSMSIIARDMEGAIRSLLDEQTVLPGKLTVDTVYFDTEVRFADHFADPNDVKIAIKPRGFTSLHDAVGRKIQQFGDALDALAEDERPEQVIFAIVTDGGENSSREYNAGAVKLAIKHQTEKYDWKFVYLGANQDAVLVARDLGIDPGSALTWNVNNTAAAASSLSTYVGTTRSAGAYAFTAQDRADNA